MMQRCATCRRPCAHDLKKDVAVIGEFAATRLPDAAVRSSASLYRRRWRWAGTPTAAVCGAGATAGIEGASKMNFLQIVVNTPPWVWVLLAFLLFLDQGLQPSTAPLWRTILPTAFACGGSGPSACTPTPERVARGWWPSPWASASAWRSRGCSRSGDKTR
jgi:hypothetical protein